MVLITTGGVRGYILADTAWGVFLDVHCEGVSFELSSSANVAMGKRFLAGEVLYTVNLVGKRGLSAVLQLSLTLVQD